MAASAGKKGFTFRFELTIAGLLGVAVVCFCIFLWMFLLGVWAGQTGLLSGFSLTGQPAIPAAVKGGMAPESRVRPEAAPAPAPEKVALAPELPPESPPPEAPPAAVSAEPLPAGGSDRNQSPPPEAVNSAYHALQVGAFREPRYAEEALRDWRAKGYEVVALPPSGGKGELIKVFLGRYPDADTARREAAKLAEKEKVSPVVASIPAEPAKMP